jgi:hypothetical protein
MKTLRYHSLRAALEDNADGKTHIEREHVIYAELTDFEELKKAASSEKQEQWVVKIPQTERNASAGQIRVRRVETPAEGVKFILTSKTFKEGGDRLEVSVDASEDLFNHFKTLAESGMIKERFHFPVEGSDRVFEVDVFMKADGTPYAWCKIDFELDNDTQLTEAIPELPVTVGKMISGDPKQFSDEQKAAVSVLYDTVFLSKNPGRPDM